MRVIIGPCPLGAKCEEQKEIAGEQCIVRCPWYQKLRGKDPQSEQEIDEFRCSIGWLPMLTVENSQMQHQTGAAVESFRNEMVKANDKMIQLAAKEQAKLLEKENGVS
jgi:hypothetical protein